MAKPALGKGLGELLHGNGAPSPHPVTETHTSAVPRLGAGMSTLVGRPSEPLRATAHTPSPVVLRASLLAADVALTVGAALHSHLHPPLDWIATATALLAVLLGAWLGWLGLTLGRE